MSNLAHKGDDYPEAAAKHLEDAFALFAYDRFDGAAYLAGYVVECALKTLVMVDRLVRAGINMGMAQNASSSQLESAQNDARFFKHSLNKLSQEIVALAALPSAATARYAPSAASTSMYAKGWTETMRYHAPNITNTVASDWVSHAETVYEQTLVKLRLDGVVR